MKTLKVSKVCHLVSACVCVCVCVLQVSGKKGKTNDFSIINPPREQFVYDLILPHDGVSVSVLIKIKMFF